MPSSRRYLVPGLAIAVVTATAAAALLTVGSPAAARMRRLDERRVDDLVAISRKVDLYWSQHAALPSSLDRLLDTPGTTIDGRDPLTRQPYTYTVTEPRRYELCADFQRPSNGSPEPARDRFWDHGTGRACFRLEAASEARSDSPRRP